MHDGETMDLFAPFGAFPGAPRHQNHLMGTVDNDGNNNSGDAINAGSIAKVGVTAPPRGGPTNAGETDGTGAGGVEPQRLDNIELNDGVGDNIADNVDGFLDDFLALVDDAGSGGEGMDVLMDTRDTDGDANGNSDGNIAEDLNWLDDMDLAAFLPPPAAPDAAFADTNKPPSSSAHEMSPAPEPAVVDGGAAAAPVAGAGAAVVVASQTEGSSQRAVEDGSSTVHDSATSAAPPSSAELSAEAAVAGAASGAPGLAEGGGAAGRNEHNDGGAFANAGGEGGGGGGDAADVSRKEQLRRQKVARYLAKKKTRQWSKAKASSYQSRQRVANSRPRHKGRFLPLESDFVPIAELQRRQRALMKQMQEKAAAARATATAEAPSFGRIEGGVAAVSGNVSPLPLEFNTQVG
eukprot:g10474.t1